MATLESTTMGDTQKRISKKAKITLAGALIILLAILTSMFTLFSQKNIQGDMKSITAAWQSGQVVTSEDVSLETWYAIENGTPYIKYQITNGKGDIYIFNRGTDIDGVFATKFENALQVYFKGDAKKAIKLPSKTVFTEVVAVPNSKGETEFDPSAIHFGIGFVRSGQVGEFLQAEKTGTSGDLDVHQITWNKMVNSDSSPFAVLISKFPVKDIKVSASQGPVLGWTDVVPK